MGVAIDNQLSLNGTLAERTTDYSTQRGRPLTLR